MDLDDQLSLASLSQQRDIKRALQKANELEEHKRTEAENHKLRQELLYQTKQKIDQIEYFFNNKKHVIGCFELKKAYKQFNDAGFTSDEFPEIDYKELLKKIVHSFDVFFRWIKTNVSLRDFQLAGVRYLRLEEEKKQLQENKKLQDAEAKKRLALGKTLCAFFVFIGSCLGAALTSQTFFVVSAGVSLIAVALFTMYSD